MECRTVCCGAHAESSQAAGVFEGVGHGTFVQVSAHSPTGARHALTTGAKDVGAVPTLATPFEDPGRTTLDVAVVANLLRRA
jgi:hypothetical protein